MTASRYDAIIIGADLNGLTAAGYLAKAGHRVLVLESRAGPGAELCTEEIAPGFRLDTCVHDAGWIPPEILRDFAISNLQETILRPDPAMLTLHPDGSHLTFWRDLDRTRDEIARRSPRDAQRWIPFSQRVQRFAMFLQSVYRSPPPRPHSTSVRDAFRLLGLARRLRGLGRRDMIELLRVLPMSVADLLDDWFESDLLKGALGGCALTGIFQGPRSGGTAFVFLHHLVGADVGVFRPRGLVRGGVQTLAHAFSSALQAHGGEIRYGVRVQRLTVLNGRISGVLTAEGEAHVSQCVVSSLDPAKTFLELVEPTHLTPEFLHAVRQIRFRGAWAKVNLALSELPRFGRATVDGDALSGVICVSPSIDYLERAYDDAKHGGISRHPYLEITLPSLQDPAVAPPGQHVMSVIFRYAPYRLSEEKWNPATREAVGDLAVRILAEYAPNVPNAILHRQVISPADLEDRFGLPEGNEYQGELTLDQVLFMRPVAGWCAYRMPVPGLFLCGTGTHPGGGITGGAGRNAARAVIHDLEKKRAS